MRNSTNHVFSLFFLFAFIGYSMNTNGQDSFGEVLELRYETPHPYPASKGGVCEILWTQQVMLENVNSSYVSVHFEKFELQKGDKLFVKNSRGEVKWTYDDSYNARGSFWSIPVFGPSLQLEIWGTNQQQTFGYSIDKVSRGFSEEESNPRTTESSICNQDDTQEAKCYQNSEPNVYTKSKTVARLWRNVPGQTDGWEPGCTAWLFGSEGHMITAGHCDIQWFLANGQIAVEIMAEGDSCEQSCEVEGACEGTIIADDILVVEEVDMEPILDYTLFHIPNPNEDLTQFGYLTAREGGAVFGERVYLPQHPLGYGKRIAVTSDSPNDPFGYPELSELSGGNPNEQRLRHYADTESRSSGSPIISYSDQYVVAIHTNGGCPENSNRGYNIQLVVDDLISKNKLPEDALAEIPCEKSLGSLIVDSPITWDYMRWVKGDIIVEPEGELKILHTVFLTPGSKIYVKRGAKLIIDGGLLTSCDGERWEGIVIEGASKLSGQINDPFGPTNASYSGTVVVINDGNIDNAVNGITTENRHIPWAQRKAYRGGLIYCDHANFTNCDRAVEIYPYGTANNLDKSSFHRTEFRDLRLGVTNWASDGITFTQCQFENIEGSATGGWDAAINVYDGNTFVNVGIGVDLHGTTLKTLSSQIGLEGYDPNLFHSGENGVWLTSVNNFQETVIENNIFEMDFGVFAEGQNLLLCRNNDFNNGAFGVRAHDTENRVEFSYNSFIGNNTGIIAINNNSGLNFEDNCMDGSSYEDVWIYGDEGSEGLINFNQGGPAFSAGNCFTKMGIPEIYTDGNTQNFEYYVELGTPELDCHYPEAEGNFALQFSQATSDEDCGSDGGIPPPPTEDCIPTRSEQTLLIEIQNLDLEISQLKNNNGSFSEINSKERCLDLSLRVLAEIYSISENYPASNLYFSTRPEFQMRLIPFSNKTQNEELVEARSYLNNLIIDGQIEANVKTALNVYLDFLENDQFNLGISDQLFLESMGANPSPLNGYLRSIYYGLTGSKIELALPSRNRSQKEVESHQEKNAISIFPNPVINNRFNIIGVPAGTKLQIFDLNGRKLLTQEEIRDNPISLKSKGVFILRLSWQGDIIFQDKLVNL
ncbi:MAG: T9SS type A sorting domain-containing protein [Saprospiraceae bacterium]|nr:T9SS type A sorting domain-containing protein [Saprospiraceae bacterium]